MPLIFSGDETTDVGVDLGSPVAEDYGVRGNQFSGTVRWVQIERGLDDVDHLISPEERWRVVVGIQ
jgi:arylsulfatase